MEIPIYKFALREDLKDDKQFLPTKGEPNASGWDVRAAQLDRKPIIIKPFEYVKIPLGFRSFCPDGWWYELRPRSSSFVKKQLHPLYGVIDQEYESEAIFAAQYIPELKLDAYTNVSLGSSYYSETIYDASTTVSIMSVNLIIHFGDAIGQLIPIKRQEMQIAEIDNTDYNTYVKNRGSIRGTGGFGSTDKLNDKIKNKVKK